jgi:Flp pilus assembly protein TadD
MFSILRLLTGQPHVHEPPSPPWDPRQRTALLHDVCTAMRLGFFREAQAMLDHEPHAARDAACLNLLGVICELRQQWKLARKHYRAAIQCDGGYAPARQNIRRFYELDTFGHTGMQIALGDERPALALLLRAHQSRRISHESAVESITHAQ